MRTQPIRYVLGSIVLGATWVGLAHFLVGSGPEREAQQDSIFVLCMLCGAAVTVVTDSLWFSSPRVSEYTYTIALTILGTITTWLSGTAIAQLAGWNIELRALAALVIWPFLVSLLTFILASVFILRAGRGPQERVAEDVH